MKVLCLLSGGLDSSTVLAQYATILPKENVGALSFNYGQRHVRELESARLITRHYGVEHYVLDFPMFAWLGGSALTDKSVPVPHHNYEEIGKGPIPSTYVPMRNTMLLSVACALAEAKGYDVVAYGANALDYSGYPDCRQSFIEAFNELLKVNSRRGEEGEAIQVIAPLVDMTKADVVRMARRLGVPIELTYSCYEGGQEACGRCDSCQLRERALRSA